MAVKRQTRLTKTKHPSKKEGPSKRASKLQAPLFNLKGQLVRKVRLPEKIFGQKVNRPLISLATKVYLANLKPRLASTKTRAQVAGGGAKPWRQKGTGRARVGSIRAPGRTGGGVVFGPEPVESRKDLPKKMKQRALVSALSAKASENSIFLVEKLDLKEPKTKKAKDFLEKSGLLSKESIGLVLEKGNINAEKTFRNLKNVKVTKAVDLNSLSVLKFSGLIFTLDALELLKKRLGEKDAGYD